MRRLTFINFFTVLRCQVCDEIFKLGREGNGVLCDECKGKLENEKQRSCEHCGLPATLCRCVPKNIMSAGCNTLIKTAFYDPDDEGVTERLILNQKDCINKDLSSFISGNMVTQLRAYLINSKINISSTVITYTPRSRKAVNEKGFDQAEILARLCAQKIGCKFFKLIKRTSSARQQKDLDGTERMENAKNSFALVDEVTPEASTVIVVDDIVTTGASLAICVKLLKNKGFENIICLAVAQTNKKRYNSTSKIKK